MFDRAREYIRGRLLEMLSPSVITDAFGVELPVNDIMANKVQKWKSLYMDLNDWIDTDEFLNFNSAGIAGAVTSELARLTLLEFDSEVTGTSERAKFLNTNYKKIVDDLGTQLEYGCALGGMVFKPYIDGDEVVVDYVQADKFYPVSFNSRGEITAIIFTEEITKENYVYTRLEFHEHVGTDYKVINRAFKKSVNSKTNRLGDEIDINGVDEWKSLSAVTKLQNIKRPLFAYLKMPIANTADTQSNLGISVFGRAENLICQSERFWNAIQWEYDAKEVAIDVNETMLRPIQTAGGTVLRGLPKGRERLFRALDAQKIGDESFYKVFSPDIRADDFYKGYNKMLQRIEFVCGLAYGTISDPNDTAKTATEIIASKQRSFNTVSAIQTALEKALTELVEAMNQWADLYGVSAGGYEMIFGFGDSILTDLATESAIRLQEVSAGLLKPEEYMKWRYGFKTDKQAQEIMPVSVTELVIDDLSHTEE